MSIIFLGAVTLPTYRTSEITFRIKCALCLLMVNE